MISMDYLRSSLIGYPSIMIEPLSKSGGYLYTCKKRPTSLHDKRPDKVGIEEYTLLT